jgi:hypothetical protein
MGMAVTGYRGTRFTQEQAARIRWDQGEAIALRNFVSRFRPADKEVIKGTLALTGLALSTIVCLGLIWLDNVHWPFYATGAITSVGIGPIVFQSMRDKIEKIREPIEKARLEINGVSYTIYDYAEQLSRDYDPLQFNTQRDNAMAAYEIIRDRYDQVAPYLEDEKQSNPLVQI